MYLTKFDVNVARRGAQRLLGSPQAMHAAVLASFPPDVSASGQGEDRARVLWRLDRGDRAASHLFIASPGQPDLTHLVEQAGWPTTHTWQSRSYTALLDRLAEGQRWAFRLKANPVHAVRVRDRKRTQPLGHVTATQQQEWLAARAAKHGFTLGTGSDGEAQVTVHSRETLRFRREGQTVTLATATFDGILEVVSATAVRAALTSGIGRAKGYGCGMLTLAPL